MSHAVMYWDKLVRVTHWLNASLFLLTYFLFEEGEFWHRWAGYTLMASTCIRVYWGFVGPEAAKIKHFFPHFTLLKSHWQALRNTRFSRGSMPYHFGHNPFAALMVLFLWFALLATAITGWMQTLDYFWGSEVMELLHEWSANITLAAVCLHVCAVFIMSYWHNKNLIKAMLWPKASRHRETPDF